MANLKDIANKLKRHPNFIRVYYSPTPKDRGCKPPFPPRIRFTVKSKTESVRFQLHKVNYDPKVVFVLSQIFKADDDPFGLAGIDDSEFSMSWLKSKIHKNLGANSPWAGKMKEPKDDHLSHYRQSIPKLKKIAEQMRRHPTFHRVRFEENPRIAKGRGTKRPRVRFSVYPVGFPPERYEIYSVEEYGGKNICLTQTEEDIRTWNQRCVAEKHFDLEKDVVKVLHNWLGGDRRGIIRDKTKIEDKRHLVEH